MSPAASSSPVSPRVTPSLVRRWIEHQDLIALNAWWRGGAPHQKLANQAWDHALSTGWLPGLQSVWGSGWVPPGRLLTLAWDRMDQMGRMGHSPAKPGLSAPAQVSLQTWLDHLTWGSPESPAHARAQPTVQILALSAALSTTTISLSRSESVWQRGVAVNNAAAAQLLCDLMQQRFELFHEIPAATLRPDPAFLDRWIDRLATAGAPLNAHHLTALLGACRCAPTPDQHAQLDRLLARSRSGIAPALLTRMLCEMALVAQRLNLDPSLLDRVHQRAHAWGALPEITVLPQDLQPWGAWGPDGRITVNVQGTTVVATHAPALILNADPGKNRAQVVRLKDHWPRPR